MVMMSLDCSLSLSTISIYIFCSYIDTLCKLHIEKFTYNITINTTTLSSENG